jgi:putative Holliday junction resolvase
MACWLGIDHGTKRIGVAVGRTAAGIASPVETLAVGEADAPGGIARIARDYEAVGVVVGWPLNADGSEGPQARLARQFAETLAEETHLDVRLWDERLSSFEADDRLKGRLTRSQKRRYQDSVAAAAFLADFLKGDGPDSAPRPSEIGDIKPAEQ